MPNRLTGQIYCTFIEQNLQQLLQNVPAEDRENMYHQHDGAPAHSAVVVEKALNNMFPNSWIGTCGPVRWPSRSPELNTLNFFLWGDLKDRVNKNDKATVEELEYMIAEAVVTITPQMVAASHDNLIRRLRLCNVMADISSIYYNIIVMYISL